GERGGQAGQEHHAGQDHTPAGYRAHAEAAREIVPEGQRVEGGGAGEDHHQAEHDERQRGDDLGRAGPGHRAQSPEAIAVEYAGKRDDQGRGDGRAARGHGRAGEHQPGPGVGPEPSGPHHHGARGERSHHGVEGDGGRAGGRGERQPQDDGQRGAGGEPEETGVAERVAGGPLEARPGDGQGGTDEDRGDGARDAGGHHDLVHAGAAAGGDGGLEPAVRECRGQGDEDRPGDGGGGGAGAEAERGRPGRDQQPQGDDRADRRAAAT